MESRDYIDGFEDFLQDHADQHKLYASDRVWTNIQQKLHPKPKWSYLVVAAIFLGLGIAGNVHDASFFLLPSPSFSTKDAPPASLQGLKAKEEFVYPEAPVVPISTRTGKTKGTSSPVETIPLTRTDTDEVRSLEGKLAESQIADQPATVEEAVIPVPEEPLTEENIASAILEMATVNKLPSLKNKHKVTVGPKTIAQTSVRMSASKALKFGWQLYASPTISYRKLSGKGLNYYTSAGSNMSSVFPTGSVENSVTHKPSVGFELGSALTYATNKQLRWKLGIQFNVNRYEVQAFHSVPEAAPMTRNTGSDGMTVVSTFRNYNGLSKTWLKNQHIMMSTPIGAEWIVFGNDRIKFNIGGTIQPTFVVNNQAYMISTNMRNYAKAPSLYKEFNVAAGAEAFVSIKGRTFRYNVGPQFRYQLFSSYKKPYPISEFLTDYGLKVSIGR